VVDRVYLRVKQNKQQAPVVPPFSDEIYRHRQENNTHNISAHLTPTAINNIANRQRHFMSILNHCVNTKTIDTTHLNSPPCSSAANRTHFIGRYLLHSLDEDRKGVHVPCKYESALTVTCNRNDWSEDGPSVVGRHIRYNHDTVMILFCKW